MKTKHPMNKQIEKHQSDLTKIETQILYLHKNIEKIKTRSIKLCESLKISLEDIPHIREFENANFERLQKIQNELLMLDASVTEIDNILSVVYSKLK